MTDEAWRTIAREICEGIREIPVTKDHPVWWCMLILDGFRSHLCPAALKIFAEYFILRRKEMHPKCARLMIRKLQDRIQILCVRYLMTTDSECTELSASGS